MRLLFLKFKNSKTKVNSTHLQYMRRDAYIPTDSLISAHMIKCASPLIIAFFFYCNSSLLSIPFL